MNTMPCPSVREVKAPKPIWKSTTKSLRTVSTTLTGTSCDDNNYGIGTLEELVQHGLHALRETLQQDKELNTLNTSIGIIGPRSAHETDNARDTGAFRILEGEKVDPFLKTMVPKETTTAAPDTSAPPAATSGEDVQMSD
jgi:hypothetical protein